MKVTDILQQSNKTLFTFELLPPVKGRSFDEISATVEPLLEFNPAYVNITYHRADMVVSQNAGGETLRRITKKRPGTVSLAAAIKFKYGLEAVPHLICGGFTREETEDALIDLSFLSIDNVLALRGDKRKGDAGFTPEPEGNSLAIDLLRQIKCLNRGAYLHPEIANATPTNFCVGVAGYPEKHEDAVSVDSDIACLKEKADAGADYVVTQMFFDNAAFLRYVERCRAAGITIPIIPGLKPLSVRRQLEILPKTFDIQLPDDLCRAVNACATDADVRQVGVEWAIAQCRELKKAGVPALHFYTMGRPDNVVQICREVF